MTTLHVGEALLAEGWMRDVRIEISGGRIAALTPGASPETGDERHGIAVAGMPSLHSHAFQRGMAGLAEVRGPAGDTFWTWRDVMYRFALSMTPDDVEAVALQLYCEMLEAGFTRVGEFHYLHHDHDGRPYANVAEMAARIAAAAVGSGIGLTLLPVFYAHAGFGGAPPAAGQRRFVNDLDGYAKLLDASRAAITGNPDANIGVAPHSLRAATPDELRLLAGLLPDSPLHIHVAEQVKEVEDCIAWSGMRPVEWLLANADVDQRWCLIHATHMTDAEAEAMARSGAVAGLCPITEANLGDGLFPARTFTAAGGRFGIGSDSNVLISVAEELRTLEYGQRLSLRERNVLAGREGASTARALFDGAIAGGARALGQSRAGLVAGARADIVTLDADHPCLTGRGGDRLLDGWIFAGSSTVVDCVWAGGDKVVVGGRHRLRDAAGRAFRATVARLIG